VLSGVTFFYTIDQIPISSFSALTLLVGDRKDIWPVRSLTSITQKFYFWRPSWNLAKPRVISGK